MMEPDEILYQHRIVADPAILVGKPTIKGTRISVELVLEHLTSTLDVGDLLEAYPHLAPDDVRACLEYALELVIHEFQEARAQADSVSHV
ncbi:MAG TPA: DUF433 domain-containing protein [Thermomicrobiales bacterium]|nr:DUF433 domain-containing protein [Thermomicrobiales bacterium]